MVIGSSLILSLSLLISDPNTKSIDTIIVRLEPGKTLSGIIWKEDKPSFITEPRRKNISGNLHTVSSEIEGRKRVYKIYEK